MRFVKGVILGWYVSLCMQVPQQLVLQARPGHSEVDDCNFDTHLKDKRNTHIQ